MSFKIITFLKTNAFLRTSYSFPLVYIRKNLALLYPLLHQHTSQKTFFNEKDFAHNLLESIPKYSDIVIPSKARKQVDQNVTTAIESVNWLDKSTSELVELFAKFSLSANIPISDAKFSDLRTAIRTSCNEMTDEQLVLILKGLSYWPFCDSPREKEFFELWNDLDRVCESRMKKWDLNKVCLFLELWHHLSLSKQSNFVFRSVTKLAQKPYRLSKEQIVLLLFHMSLLRTLTKSTSMFELENRLTAIAEELTLDELAVSMMGFFKGDKSIFNEKLMNTLINRLIQGLGTASDISFTAIIKVLRRCLPTSLWSRAEELADAIVLEVDRLSLPACVHATLFLTKPQFQHHTLLQSVSQKLVNNISVARLKDMEKVVFSLIQLAFDPQTSPCIFSTILEELDKPERNLEIDTYPKSFIALIHYLCIRGIFSQKWIRKILDPDFIIKTYGRNKFIYGRELLYIDCCVELNFPDYTGPRLPSNMLNYLSKKYSEYLPDPQRKLSRHQKWHYEVTQTAEMLFEKRLMCQKYLLPNHSRADIVVHVDDSGTYLPIDESLMNSENHEGFLKSPGPNYYALVPVSQNMFLYKSNLLNGESNSKLRQLELIGYTPIVVSSKDWPGNRGTLEKVQYLRDLLQDAQRK